jgi:hypothetical protein
MLDEGTTLTSTPATLRSAMVRQIVRLGHATADEWERAVFESIIGGRREDVDWEFQDNQAGYYMWLKSFDRYARQLVADGFVDVVVRDGQRLFLAFETDPPIDWSAFPLPAA